VINLLKTTVSESDKFSASVCRIFVAMVVMVKGERRSIEFVEDLGSKRFPRSAEANAAPIQTQDSGGITIDEAQVMRHRDHRQLVLIL
jgi:hypothetical protein